MIDNRLIVVLVFLKSGNNTPYTRVVILREQLSKKKIQRMDDLEVNNKRTDQEKEVEKRRKNNLKIKIDLTGRRLKRIKVY